MNVLDTIMAERRNDVESARIRAPVEHLRAQAKRRKHRSLAARLADARGTRIIAEMKKASPSAGTIRSEYEPASLARACEAAGAAGISVLTEPRHFRGSEEHLRAVRAAVDLPVLRKDFICDSYQVCEAAAWGADAVLLILAGLDRATARELYAEALRCGLDVLAETHTRDQVRFALELEKAIVGVNSRDLTTLKTDLRCARELIDEIPDARLAVAESGISSRKEIEELERLGYDGFLIGGSIMQASDPAVKLRQLAGFAG